MFPSPVGEKAEIYFDIDTTKSLCGGGALCFNLNTNGKSYWIGYPFRAGVEWDAAINGNKPVPTTVDLTDISIMNVNCWSENRPVVYGKDDEELKMLAKACQESTTAEIQLWWSLDLNWGDRPDSSVTAGKSESEVSALKAAAAKECIAVINVRPINLPLDTNMGHGSWNTGNTEVKGDVNADGKFNITDAVILQKWLLNIPNTKLDNWKAADLCKDERLDVFDMVEMRKLLVQNK